MAPPPPGGKKGRTSPILLVAVVIAVITALAVGVVGVASLDDEPTADAGTDDATTEPTPPAAWDPRVAPIADWVADERDLEFEHPVEVVFQDEEEYLEQASGDPTDLSEEEQQEMDDFVAVLRALGLVAGDVDLGQATSDLAGEATLAYYDPATQVVSIRGEELTPAVRVTVAHELTHVLQDQHFDLERLADPDFEDYEGLRAMAEGDAGRIEDAYAQEVLTAPEREEYEAESAASIEDAQAGTEDVPAVMSIIFSAPYLLGETFLTYREAVDGGQPWDAVLEDPPTGEELLDPAVWETARAEVADVTVEAPEGAEVISEDTFDPLTWFLLLASRGEPAAALEVVDGWGGDAYVSYRDGDAVCAAMAVVGDDAAATDVFHVALVQWAAAAPSDTTTVEVVGDAVEVRACDPGPDATATGTVTEEVVTLPAIRGELEAQMQVGGASEDQARCASRAFLSTLTPEELTSTAPIPGIQERITEAMTGCL